MPALPVSTLFIGLFALLQFPMTIMVGYRRAQTEIPFLDGGDATLLRRMRAHGNFVLVDPGACLGRAARLRDGPHLPADAGIRCMDVLQGLA